uniref:E3 ubiquitin-protein ligase BRE1B n=1 Tax=Ciona intestinalis TaxID=7719 RepID=UPI000180CFE6|nr:E3 ubiquitin-protein ligase BRE1B [Ciona intestinalis]|eukprot:XP_002119359.1 E3 ubiquitin-protein ligase BRE1B [Ciona intestinalis]
MASKRQLDAGPTSDSDEPQAKRPTTILPAVSIGPVASLEEMDLKMLKFQNKKLWEKIEIRRQAERELEDQIETMEAKQTATDATLSLVNRYWDQLDENIKITLKRLGQDSDEVVEENSTQDEEDLKKKSFHRLLCDNDFQVIKENVADRLDFSRRTFAKVIDAILDQKKQQTSISEAIKENENVEEHLKTEVGKLEEANNNLQELTTGLQAEHHKFYMDRSNVEEKINLLEERVEELQETAETARWELKKTRLREDRLTRHLAEALDKINKGTLVEASTSNAAAAETETAAKAPNEQAEEAVLLAESRLNELETLKKQHQDCLKELERAKIDLRNIPDSLIIQSSEYRTLKSQFSVLYHESVQMKTMLDESRVLIQQTRNSNLRRIEQMEVDELQTQTKLRNELIQLEDTLAKVRHDYESLHTELEQNLAANEQAGPVNREMRHLINSLQNHNRQLKGEIQRYKRKIKDLQNELAKSKQEEIRRLQDEIKHESDKLFSSVKSVKLEEDVDVKKEVVEEEEEATSNQPGFKSNPQLYQEIEDLEKKLNDKGTEMEKISKELKTTNAEMKELKLLLDMYKGLSKEQRDKAEIMANEKVATSARDDLEKKIRSLEEDVAREDSRSKELEKKLQRSEEQLADAVGKVKEEKDRREKKEEELLLRGPDADSLRKMKVLEETIIELRRNLSATKQEEEALLSEMDVTGQAFEDMQEQNMRLLQQLREKDDANFKLMSERIKANQVHKLLQEEKSVLQDQNNTLHMQVDSQNQVVRMLEEKERSLQGTLVTMEKELNLRSQIMDLHKRKAVEMTQIREDLLRDVEKKKERLSILEESMDRKVENLEEEHFKLSRLQEDGAKLRRKLEKHKKTEGLYSADEVLMEEIKEYKTKLRCPCCNVNNKDAVLTKCFHVFCIKCIKTRYETRQRKCPKCNAGFGGNDFHRIYIE